MQFSKPAPSKTQNHSQEGLLIGSSTRFKGNKFSFDSLVSNSKDKEFCQKQEAARPDFDVNAHNDAAEKILLQIVPSGHKCSQKFHRGIPNIQAYLSQNRPTEPKPEEVIPQEVERWRKQINKQWQEQRSKPPD